MGDILEKVHSVGHTVQYVFGSPRKNSFFYTIGAGRYEILAFAPPDLSKDHIQSFCRVVNTAVSLITDNRSGMESPHEFHEASYYDPSTWENGRRDLDLLRAVDGYPPMNVRAYIVPESRRKLLGDEYAVWRDYCVSHDAKRGDGTPVVTEGHTNILLSYPSPKGLHADDDECEEKWRRLVDLRLLPPTTIKQRNEDGSWMAWTCVGGEEGSNIAVANPSPALVGILEQIHTDGGAEQVRTVAEKSLDMMKRWLHKLGAEHIPDPDDPEDVALHEEAKRLVGDFTKPYPDDA